MLSLVLSADNIHPFQLYRITVAPLYPGTVGPPVNVYTYSGEKGLSTLSITRILSSLSIWALATGEYEDKCILLLLASEAGAFHHGLHWAPQSWAEDGVIDRERIRDEASFTDQSMAPTETQDHS